MVMTKLVLPHWYDSGCWNCVLWLNGAAGTCVDHGSFKKPDPRAPCLNCGELRADHCFSSLGGRTVCLCSKQGDGYTFLAHTKDLPPRPWEQDSRCRLPEHTLFPNVSFEWKHPSGAIVVRRPQGWKWWQADRLEMPCDAFKVTAQDACDAALNTEPNAFEIGCEIRQLAMAIGEQSFYTAQIDRIRYLADRLIVMSCGDPAVVKIPPPGIGKIGERCPYCAWHGRIVPTCITCLGSGRCAWSDPPEGVK